MCKCDEVALKLLFFHYTALCVASLSLCFCWRGVWRMSGKKTVSWNLYEHCASLAIYKSCFSFHLALLHLHLNFMCGAHTLLPSFYFAVSYLCAAYIQKVLRRNSILWLWCLSFSFYLGVALSLSLSPPLCLSVSLPHPALICHSFHRHLSLIISRHFFSPLPPHVRCFQLERINVTIFHRASSSKIDKRATFSELVDKKMTE